MKDKRSERNRRETDKWFQILVETMNEGLGILDAQGMVKYFNPALCKMLGYSLEEAIGKPILDFFEDTDKKILAEHVGAHLLGNFEQYELRFKTKDGGHFIGHISPRPLLDQAGELKNTFAVITDITEQKQKNIQINKLSKVVKQSPVGVVITDSKGTIEYVNNRFCTITGYSSAELIGKNPRILQSGLTDAEFYKMLWNALTQGEDCKKSVQNKKKNGEIYWTDETFFSIKNPQGNITNLVALHEDVTAQKQAEIALAESETKYHTLVEKSLVGIVIIQNHRLVYFNQIFSQKFGYSQGELENMEYIQLIHPDDRERFSTLIGKVLQGKENSDNLIIMGLTKDQRTLTLKIAFIPITYCGKPAILKNVIDITVEKQLENQLSAYSRQLESHSKQLIDIQEQERKRIASELHDGIGQYLNALKFGLQQMKSEEAELQEETVVVSNFPGLIDLVQEAIEEVRRISADLRPAILDDLGIISTINWYCRRFQASFTGILIEKEVEVQEHDIPEPLKVTIYRVLQESLNNIAKHAEASLVHVRLSKSAGLIHLSVSDNGLGFAIDQAVTNEAIDRGFGLVSMKERVHLSGGYFAIESSLSQGTTVSAQWPVSLHADEDG